MQFNCKLTCIRLKKLSEHPGPALHQAQWNVVKLGNPSHAGQCKQQRFKNIRIEAVDPTASKTIPIMTDGVINVS